MYVNDKFDCLRIKSGDSLNEYRITEGRVEFRSLKHGCGYEHSWGTEWTSLTDAEIELHHALRTVVSRWMRVRLDSAHTGFDIAA